MLSTVCQCGRLTFLALLLQIDEATIGCVHAVKKVRTVRLKTLHAWGVVCN